MSPFSSVRAAVVALATMSMIVMPIVGFYVPGENPMAFEEGEVVPLKVNKLTSSRTLLPLDYYHMPFCRPEYGVMLASENIGEFLAGDRIHNSPYLLKMKTDMYCEHLCIMNLGRPEQKGLFPSKLARVIRNEYRHNWIVDNLPAALKTEIDDLETTRYWRGFPVGYVHSVTKKAHVYNHVNIEISYHEARSTPGIYRIVGFAVEPFSFHHDFDFAFHEDWDEGEEYNGNVLPPLAKIHNPIRSCDKTIPREKREHTSFETIMMAEPNEEQVASGNVLFTYDVIWLEDPDATWASRWDIYLNMGGTIPSKVHWLSIMSSFVIFILLSAAIALLLTQILREATSRYQALPTTCDGHYTEANEHFQPDDSLLVTAEDRQDKPLVDVELSTWASLHEDVFRPPTSYPMMLAVLSGTGAQLLSMTFWLILLSSLGFVNPSRRGSLVTAAILLYVLSGCVGGYVTARFYKTFRGQQERKATLTAAFLFPGSAMFFHLLYSFIGWCNLSTYSVPFITSIILLILWLGLGTPLVMVGAYCGFKTKEMDYPTNTSSIPRPIPDQPWMLRSYVVLFLGGLLPYFALVVELYYMLMSAWMEYYYYTYGVLLLVFFLTVAICAEVSVVNNYIQLCEEDHRWWWRSFYSGGSAAIYILLHSIVFFRQFEATTLVAYLIYFGAMIWVSFGLFCMLGFVGLISSLHFNRVIYASIQV